MDNIIKRLDKESVYLYLDSNKINYKRAEFSRRMETMEDCQELAEQLGSIAFKNLYLQTRNKDKSFLLLISPFKKFKTAVVSKEIGTSRLSFGSNEELYDILGVKAGSVSPVGLVFDKDIKIKVLIDRELLNNETLAMHPLDNTELFKISIKDMINEFIIKTGHEYIIVNP